jgi:hypothetical protein
MNLPLPLVAMFLNNARNAGGSPPPPPPSGVEPLSANGRGVLFTMASDPGVDVLDQPETMVRTGYTVAGGTTPTTWHDPFRIRRKARVAGTASTLRPTEFTSSKVVMLGDTILGRSITNNSTRGTGPIIEHRWVSPSNYVADASDTSSAAFGTVYNRNGTPIAFVVFRWQDSLGASITTIVSAPSKRTCPLTGFVGQVYVGAAPAGWSTLADGAITKTYTAYGHYGQVVTSNVVPALYHGATPCPQVIRKRTGFEPVYVYFAATGTNTSTLPSSPGINITGAAPSLANCYPLTAAGYNNASAAAMALNNSTNSGFGTVMDGVVIRLKGDGTGTADIGTWTGGSTDRTCQLGGVTVEADPNEYTGSFRPIVTLNAWPTRLAGSTAIGAQQGIMFRRLRIARLNGSTVTTIFGVASQVTHVWFRDCIYDGQNINATIGPVSSGSITFEDTELVNFTSGGSSHFQGSLTVFIKGFIGVRNTTGMNNMQVSANYLMGSQLTNVRLVTNLSAGMEHGHLFDASAAMGGTATTQYVTAQQGNTRGKIYRNFLCEMLVASNGVRFGGFSADNETNSLNTVGFQGCAYPGSLGDGVAAGANRKNFAYLDNPDDVRVHDWITMVGCLPPLVANKGDKFPGTTASNYDGWSEFGNGVGSAGNFYTRRQASASFDPDDHGSGSYVPADSLTEQLPGYLAPGVPTVFGGSNGAGAASPLDYRLKSEARGIGNDGEAFAIGRVAYIPEMLWDILGNDLPANVVQTTPGPFAGLYA